MDQFPLPNKPKEAETPITSRNLMPDSELESLPATITQSTDPFVSAALKGINRPPVFNAYATVIIPKIHSQVSSRLEQGGTVTVEAVMNLMDIEVADYLLEKGLVMIHSKSFVSLPGITEGYTNFKLSAARILFINTPEQRVQDDLTVYYAVIDPEYPGFQELEQMQEFEGSELKSRIEAIIQK